MRRLLQEVQPVHHLLAGLRMCSAGGVQGALCKSGRPGGPAAPHLAGRPGGPAAPHLAGRPTQQSPSFLSRLQTASWAAGSMHLPPGPLQLPDTAIPECSRVEACRPENHRQPTSRQARSSLKTVVFGRPPTAFRTSSPTAKASLSILSFPYMTMHKFCICRVGRLPKRW